MVEKRQIERMVAAKVTDEEHAHLELIRAYLRDRTQGSVRVTDSDAIRWALARTAHTLYLELQAKEKDRVEASHPDDR